ncbi:hypothetical protein K1719_011979 [Acacia pycnantha]|nr:hypothetical protein K1719_011979 [Acacia pycnantha]
MKFTLFSAINDSKETWSVHAKVLRKWVVKRKTPPFAVWKIGMLLVDEEDQRRESDVIKKLNFSMADQHENSINVTLWGDCAEETYGKKSEDMEPPIFVLVRFARLNKNTEYGHLSNPFNATLVTLNPNIPEALLLKERLSQDSVGTQLFSQISNIENPTYKTESLLHFRTRIPLCDVLKLDEECDVVTKVTIQKVETLYGWSYDACPCDKKPEYQSNGSFRCSKCNKDVLMTVPKFKVHYKVYDGTGKCSVIFFDRQATELLGKSASKVKEDMHKESSASKESVRSESDINVVEEDDNTLSQMCTPVDCNSKRKIVTGEIESVCVDIGLSQLATPTFSTTKPVTKPVKNIKKEK